MSLLIPDPIPIRPCSRCTEDSPLINVFPALNGGTPIEVYRCRTCQHIEHIARGERRPAE
jgi:hypothetical protein